MQKMSFKSIFIIFIVINILSVPVIAVYQTLGAVPERLVPCLHVFRFSRRNVCLFIAHRNGPSVFSASCAFMFQDLQSRFIKHSLMCENTVLFLLLSTRINMRNKVFKTLSWCWVFYGTENQEYIYHCLMKCLLTPNANSPSCCRLITLAPPPEKISKEIWLITESVSYSGQSRWW